MCCIRACPRRSVWVVVSHVPSTGEVSGDVLSLCIPSGEWLGDAFSLRLPWGTGRARLIKQPRGQTGFAELYSGAWFRSTDLWVMSPTR
jgi:hypothetical protein